MLQRKPTLALHDSDLSGQLSSLSLGDPYTQFDKAHTFPVWYSGRHVIPKDQFDALLHPVLFHSVVGRDLGLPPCIHNIHKTILLTGQTARIFSCLYSVNKLSLFARHSPFSPLQQQPSCVSQRQLHPWQRTPRVPGASALAIGNGLLTSLRFTCETKPRKSVKTGSSPKCMPTNRTPRPKKRPRMKHEQDRA